MKGRMNVMCVLLVMYQVCESFVHVRSSYRQRHVEPDTESVCSGSTCGIYNYSYILRRFPGIFYTREQIAVKGLKFSLARQNYLKKQGVYVQTELPGDGDSCCPTKIKSFTNLTMENVDEETKYIVHMPPRYQFIPHGFCLQGGKCDGSCVVEPVVQTLLTYDATTLVLEFDQFIVPGYCSCKAT